ncbi:MAG: FUSC family protein [Bacteroidota bacterium]
MNQKVLSQLTDEELLAEFKKIKPAPIMDAFFIGFLIGIVFFSLATSSWGLVTLIPLFIIYGLLKKPKKYKALKEELESRGLQ